jgi:hypothetical protein
VEVKPGMRNRWECMKCVEMLKWFWNTEKSFTRWFNHVFFFYVQSLPKKVVV